MKLCADCPSKVRCRVKPRCTGVGGFAPRLLREMDNAEKAALHPWKPPFRATLFNEAREPHDEIKLMVCHQQVIRNGRKYRLIEFASNGAAYEWCGWAPTETPTKTAR